MAKAKAPPKPAGSTAGLMKKFSLTQQFKELHFTCTFVEYLDMVRKDPNIVRNAYQRIYDMVVSHGHEDYERHRETFRR